MDSVDSYETKRPGPPSRVKRNSGEENNLLEVEQMLPPPKGRKNSSTDIMDLKKVDLPFIGLGDCNTEVPKEPHKPLSHSEVIDYYLQILKVDCLPIFKKETQKLFDSNLVTVTKDSPRIFLNTKNPQFKKKTVGENEWLDMSSAIFLSSFSNIYTDQNKKYNEKNPENKSPDEKRLSGTLGTLTLLSFRLLDLMRSSQKPHAIKLSNLLLVTLQGQRSEFSTAQDELEKCEECSLQKEINLNDQIQLRMLMRFIVNKLGEIVSSGSQNIQELFKSFYIKNLETIVRLVKNKKPFVF